MDCPQTILVNKENLYINFYTSYDYVQRKWIPKKYWLNPFRYEFKIFGVWFNRDWKYRVMIGNIVYRTKRLFVVFDSNRK